MIQLLAEPLQQRLAAAIQAHLAGDYGPIDADQLARELLPAVGAHTAQVLGLLVETHERRAAAVVGDRRAANSLRAAYEDAAETARNLARFYNDTTENDL